MAVALLFADAPQALAQENIRLSCSPRTFRVVPGQPIRLELTVRAQSASPIRLHVPANAQLVLRAVEKYPVRRSAEGRIVHRRVVIWQAVEPGTVKINAISVQSKGRKRVFPEITITVSDPGK